MEESLAKIYTDPKNAGSFGGVSSLLKAGKKLINGLTRKDVVQFLRTRPGYTRNRQKIRKFPRRKILAYKINDIWQADLVEMKSFPWHNKGVNYLLTIVDTLSGYGRVGTLKNKQGVTVADAFEEILNSAPQQPIHLFTDQGKEFLNKDFKAVLEKHNINHYTSKFSSGIKAGNIERWNRSLKAKLYKYFVAKNTFTYLPVLQDICDGLNKRESRVIKMSPASVDKSNERLVFDRRYKQSKDMKRGRKPKFELDQTVRIAEKQTAFDKAYTGTFSTKYYAVSEIIHTNPIVYRVRDLEESESLPRIFYKEELVAAIPQNDENIVEIPKKRRKI